MRAPDSQTRLERQTTPRHPIAKQKLVCRASDGERIATHRERQQFGGQLRLFIQPSPPANRSALVRPFWSVLWPMSLGLNNNCRKLIALSRLGTMRHASLARPAAGPTLPW